MNRKHIIISISMIAIAFSGCGNNEVEGFIDETVEQIAITEACTTPPTIENYIELQSGDQIIKESSDAQVRLYHNENNLKQVCIESGRAYIARPI